jgi:hypothetical protein
MASSTSDRSRPIRAALLAIFAFAPGVSASPAPAAAMNPTKAAAEAKLVDGVQLLKTRAYRPALERFEQAYALVPSPLIFYDFGLAYRGLEDAPRALESFERFLVRAPDAPADKRRKAELFRDELGARVSVVTLEADLGVADLTLDGLDLGRVSLPRPLYLDPGSHELVARAGASVQAATLVCVAGQRVSLALRLAPPPTSVLVGTTTNESVTRPSLDRAPIDGPSGSRGAVDVLRTPPPGSSGGSVRPWALSAAAVGVASLGVGIAFGLMAKNNGDNVTGDSQNSRTFVPNEETAGLRDERLEVVFLALGAAAVAAAAGLYAWTRHRGHGGPSPGSAP